MKGMQQFLISAQVIPTGNFIFGIELANNLRDAWRFFKKSHKNYNHLHFHSASTSQRSYFKLY